MKMLKDMFSRFIQDECPNRAAALAYYAILSMPPLLFLIVLTVGSALSIAYEEKTADEKAEQLVKSRVTEIIGNESAAGVVTQVLRSERWQRGVWWKSLLGFVGVLAGATGVMGAVQTSMNHIWHAGTSSRSKGLKKFFGRRLLSLAIIVGTGLLLVASLAISTFLAMAGEQFSAWSGIDISFFDSVNQAVTLLAIITLIAMLYKYLPDVRVFWKDAWVGAFIATILFFLGRMALSTYFNMANPGAELGSAAASLVVLMVWIYYSGMIFLLGAEFTRAWAKSNGRLADE
jgi:membrane protein